MRFLTLACVAGLLLLGACAQRSAWTVPVQPVDVAALAEVAPSGRLPGTARPQAYRVTLDLDPRETHFSGQVEIDIQLAAATNGIWLHGDDLDVSRVTATAGRETVEAGWDEILDTGVVWVSFPRRLEARRVTLAIDYTAPFDTSLAGLFRVESQGNWYALAKSESIQARRFLPGFDEPGLKAPFHVTITVPEGMHAIANTPEVAREAAGDGFETIRFAPTRPLSTYLLSAAVGNFDKVERPDLPPNDVRRAAIPLTGYARAGKGEELAFALDLTPEMMRVFEEMLGQPYPYEKLDIIAAPQWPSGATELAAAITYREGRILVGPNTGPSLLRSVKEIHAHEIAHMWFGNLVTPPWWDDLWLKEGFAVWSETAVLSIMEPGNNHELAAVIDGIRAMSLDSLKGARAVAEPIDRNEDVRNAYDAITYSKGQSVIRMVDAYFGPEVLRPALGRYIARYADGEADSARFYEAIGRASGEPEIGRVFESFVTQPGVPVVRARPVCGAGIAKIEFTQSRYRPIGSEIQSGSQWRIPVCATWKDGANGGEVCALLSGAKRTVDVPGAICPEIIVPNSEGSGYYRFDLPAENWRALTENFAGLEAREALVSLDSAQAGFNAGTLDAEEYLRLLEASLTHPHGTVLITALNAWDSLLLQLGEGADPARARAAAALADREAPAELEAQLRLRGFEAGSLQDPAARAALVEEVDAFLSGQGQLSSDLYTYALRAALEDGGTAMFDRVVEATSRIDDAVFLQAAANTLGAAAAPEDAARALDLIYDGGISQQVTFSLAESLMNNPDHRAATWARITGDFPGFTSRLPAQSRRATPRLARAFCDPSVIPDLEALFAAGSRDLAGHERALDETKEYLTLCAAQQDHARQAFGPVLADPVQE
ncbi:peptidase, family M1 [Hyphomonas neptunium ATCC 15444]|uniref:Aminopeptidase n=2 Tax=Hyphomonas TaxID=85 RepID=Q0BYF1_HYPNA|nr:MULTISPECIES: M1 family metallopeptidase [Hyphomonas]ABI75845.1 peptidase, family M1 [Hyphomonas neptunium ATCC 15444]KCZ83851.1 M1 family peptidase [Hyphomonas hirschiana VP5]